MMMTEEGFLIIFFSISCIIIPFGCTASNVTLNCDDFLLACPGEKIQCVCTEYLKFNETAAGFDLKSPIFLNDISIFAKSPVNFTNVDPKGFVVTVIERTDSYLKAALHFYANPSFQHQKITCVSFGNGDHQDSRTIQFPNPPSSPKHFSYTSKNYNSVVVSWDPPHRTEREPALTGYILKISPKPKGGHCKSGRCPLLNESAKNYTIHHLKFGIKYTITIVALNCIGRSDNTLIEVLTIAEKPHINANVTVVHDMATSDSNESDFIEVSWNIMESNRQPPINLLKIELEHDNRKIYNVAYSVTNHTHIFPIKHNDDSYVARLIAENAKGRSVVSKTIYKFPFKVNISLYDTNTFQIDCIRRRLLHSCTVMLHNGTTLTKQFGNLKIISFQFSRNNATEVRYTMSTEVIRGFSSIKTFYKSRHVYRYEYNIPINLTTGTNTTVATNSCQRYNLHIYILIVMVVMVIMYLEHF